MTRKLINTDWIVEIARKCNNGCIKCKCKYGLEVHHIIPLSKGGEDTPENTILLCKLCHKMVHSKKINLNLYEEEIYYARNSEATIGSEKYSWFHNGWEMKTDDTDHFEFNCPHCKVQAIVYKIFIQDYNSLNTPPCFYLKLKCPRCKNQGQRKMYLNWSIDEIEKFKREENNGTETN